ncbi:Transcription factor bHLH93 [Hibiscus syriacus]|uniref:Transcription factor bHLH93 n=1 Tax=Hibiscus syriacus TaxID=106335 RepID=A0A6A2WGP7_HIBSY|nr:Transcription factor bHLH93 [Hibiscus syriacus]
MEMNEQGFLEELLGLRRDNWDTVPTEMNAIFSNDINFDCFDDAAGFLPDSFSQDLSFNFNNVYDVPFGDEFCAAPQLTDTSNNTFDTTPFPIQDCFNMVEETESGFLVHELHMLDAQALTACKAEPIQSPEAPSNMRTCSTTDRNNRAKKLKGQPSKNLMAERRRRKRLNDRLSMLRTSILGDTIDYTKELLERITNLQQEIEAGSSELKMAHIFNEIKPNDILVRKTPKFEVERRDVDTRIEIGCSGKQGLLLSTLTTLEALGLEIEQCVISCFNDFAMQASCSEDLKQRTLTSSEDIKQTLFRNAGYAGRCL